MTSEGKTTRRTQALSPSMSSSAITRFSSRVFAIRHSPSVRPPIIKIVVCGRLWEEKDLHEDRSQQQRSGEGDEYTGHKEIDSVQC